MLLVDYLRKILGSILAVKAHDQDILNPGIVGVQQRLFSFYLNFGKIFHKTCSTEVRSEAVVPQPADVAFRIWNRVDPLDLLLWTQMVPEKTALYSATTCRLDNLQDLPAEKDQSQPEIDQTGMDREGNKQGFVGKR